MSDRVGTPTVIAAATRRLDVRLEGVSERVGTLAGQLGTGFAMTFTYDPAYLQNHAAIPLSVSLPLRAEPYPDYSARAFFDNLLPEGERRRTEALALRTDPADVIGLLEALGAECPGAVSVLPEEAPPVKAPGRLPEDYEPLDDTRLADLVAAAAAGRKPGEHVRVSVAGVQWKLALARDLQSGRFLLPRNGAPTTHILKVEPQAADLHGIVANETLCLDVFRRLGLPTVSAERTTIVDVPVLVVVRYDRERHPDGLITRRHQEDAAQVLGVLRELKYEEDAEKAGVPPERRGYRGLLETFSDRMRAPVDARNLLLGAAFANWLLGNSDAHLKNFATLCGPARVGVGVGARLGFGYDLAPFYDVVCLAAMPAFDQRLAMRIGHTDQWDEVGREDWEALIRLIFPGRRAARTALERQLVRLRAMAEAVIPAIDATVAENVVSRVEAKPIRDAVGARVRHLNRTFGWELSAETDTPISRGGGWSLS